MRQGLSGSACSRSVGCPTFIVRSLVCTELHPRRPGLSDVRRTAGVSVLRGWVREAGLAFFDDLLALVSDAGGSTRPLDVLTRSGAYVRFERDADAGFRMAEAHGLPPGAAYPFLEEDPSVWSRALDSGWVMLPDGPYAHRKGNAVYVVVDRPPDPGEILVVETPERSGELGPLLRQLLLLDGLMRVQSAWIDLPVWLREILPRVPRKNPLLVVAEPGSGKEEFVLALLTRFLGGADEVIFFHPGRLSGPVQLRELFGDSPGVRLHAPGSVAIVDRPARAVVIEEVGDLDSFAQLRLLSLFTGGANLDRLWILETARDLKAMAETGHFDPGLARLLVDAVVLPPVRVQKDRISDEVMRLLRVFQKQYGRNMELGEGVLEMLERYDWPGNWRELKTTVESAFLLAPGPVIEKEGFRLGHWAVTGDADSLNLRRQVKELERSLFLRAYALHGGNQVQMARALGISRGSLQYRLRQLGLSEEGR